MNMLNSSLLLQIPVLAFTTAYLPMIVHAQNSYSFSEHTVPYVELQDGSSMPCTFDANGFDQISELNGETFEIYNIPFTFGGSHTIHVGDYGFVRIDNDTSSIIIDGLFTFLAPFDASSSIRYSITGASGSKILTVQWKHQNLTSGPAGNFANWQIRLHQGTGVIEVHFGENSGETNVFSDPAGPNCGIFHAPDDFTMCYEKLWVEGDPMDLTLDSLPNFGFNVLTGFPLPDKLYRFTPRDLVNTVNENMFLDHELIVRTAEENILIQIPDHLMGGDIQVIDPAGRICLERKADLPLMSIQAGSLSAGVNIIRVTSDAGTGITRIIRP